MPASAQAKARELGAVVTQARQQSQATGPSAPANSGDGGNAALRQNQNNQDKVQSPGSPTDKFAGKTVQSARVDPPKSQQKGRGWER
jgi:hypothetical protein